MVGEAMVDGFRSAKMTARYLVLDFDQNGIMAV